MTLRLSTLQKNPALFIDIRDLLEELAKDFYVPAGRMEADHRLSFAVNYPHPRIDSALAEFKTKARQILEAAKKAEE